MIKKIVKIFIVGICLSCIISCISTDSYYNNELYNFSLKIDGVEYSEKYNQNLTKVISKSHYYLKKYLLEENITLPFNIDNLECSESVFWGTSGDFKDNAKFDKLKPIIVDNDNYKFSLKFVRSEFDDEQDEYNEHYEIYNKIVNEISTLLDNQEAYLKMSTAVNPYGDGKACGRIIAALKE